MKRTRVVRALSSCMMTALICPIVLAGQLAPPGGPVAPTMKTLQQVEPRTPVNATNTPGDVDSVYVISQPGSYYLLEDLTGEPAKHGIKIIANDVTLDLRGFTLIGGPTTLNGIFVSITSPRTVRSGPIIQGPGRLSIWGGDGLQAVDTIRGRITDVISADNEGIGINMGTSATVLRCTAESNIGGGVRVGSISIIADTIAYLCGGAGIKTGSNAQVSHCVAISNQGNGIEIGPNSSLTNCAANSNVGDGIVFSGGCMVESSTANFNVNGFANAAWTGLVTDCSASFNNVDGFVFTQRIRINGCAASSNGQHGFSGEGRNQHTDCHTAGNGGDGFRTDGLTSFLTCTANSNGSNGFQLAANCTIIDCQVSGAVNAGITGQDNCLIRGNHVINTPNSTAISIVGSRSRIENNTISNTQDGITVTGVANFIVRNTVTQNTGIAYPPNGPNVVGMVRFDTINAGPWDNFRY